MAYVLIRTLALDDISEDWKGCYISFREPSVKEAQKLTEIDTESSESFVSVMKLLEQIFIKGKAFDGEKVVDIVSEDLKELPLSIITRAVSFLLTQVQSVKPMQKL
jgi:hypothetical protein